MKIIIAKDTVATLAKDSADLVTIALEAFGSVTPKGEEVVKLVKDVPLEVTTEHENFSIIYDDVSGEYTIWLNDDLIIRQWKQHNAVSAAIIKAAGALAFVVKPMLEHLSEIFDSWSKKKKTEAGAVETSDSETPPPVFTEWSANPDELDGANKPANNTVDTFVCDFLTTDRNKNRWQENERFYHQYISLVLGDCYVAVTDAASGKLLGYAMTSKPDDVPDTVKIVQVNDFWVFDVSGINIPDETLHYFSHIDRTFALTTQGSLVKKLRLTTQGSLVKKLHRNAAEKLHKNTD